MHELDRIMSPCGTRAISTGTVFEALKTKKIDSETECQNGAQHFGSELIPNRVSSFHLCAIVL